MLDKIKDYMNINNISKYDLSAKSGLPSNVVYDVFNGKRPASNKRMNQFLAALNLEAVITLKEKG